MYTLTDRNVLIVAGSRGLGARICLKFAAEGAHLAINYVSSGDRAAAVAKECEERFGVRTVLVQGDAGVASECVRVVEEAREKLGGLDVVVQNAVCIRAGARHRGMWVFWGSVVDVG